jgi:hypothetical protein
MSPRQREPSVADGYNEWREKVIGSNRLADPDTRKAGRYGMHEYKAKRLGLTVKAQVYPFLGAPQGDDQPHAWGVVFPEQSRLTEYDPKTDGAKETRPYAPERRFGGKAPDLATAKANAVECIRRGGWDEVERNDNGTLKALNPTKVIYDDVPD